MNPETPEADAAEQLRPATEDIEEDETAVPAAENADPGDVAEQRRVVPDEDSDER